MIQRGLEWHKRPPRLVGQSPVTVCAGQRCLCCPPTWLLHSSFRPLGFHAATTAEKLLDFYGLPLPNELTGPAAAATLRSPIEKSTSR